MKKILMLVCLPWLATMRLPGKATAQEYVSPIAPTPTGKSPGVKIKLLSSQGNRSSYVIVFSPGDEVKSGLTEFAQKYQVKTAYFTAVGSARSARLGAFDYERKMFKVIPIDTPCEVSSLMGNIAAMDGKPTVHAHVNVADMDGVVRGGHLLELVVESTLEVFVTVEPSSLNKKVDKRYGASVIDIAKEQ